MRVSLAMKLRKHLPIGLPLLTLVFAENKVSSISREVGIVADCLKVPEQIQNLNGHSESPKDTLNRVDPVNKTCASSRAPALHTARQSQILITSIKPRPEGINNVISDPQKKKGCCGNRTRDLAHPKRESYL